MSEPRELSWQEVIAHEATAAKIAPALALAVAEKESNFDPAARGKLDEIGLFQLRPTTAKDLGVDATNPLENIRGGLRYLQQQLQASGGDVGKALGTYNAGPKGTPNPAYVEDVLSRLPKFETHTDTQTESKGPAPPVRVLQGGFTGTAGTIRRMVGGQGVKGGNVRPDPYANRQDATLLGMDPGLLVAGGLGTSRLVMGVVKSAVPMAEKALMLTKALGVPMVKYEVTKHALTAMGIPEVLAEMAAAGASGYRRGGAPMPAEAAAVAEATGPIAATEVAPVRAPGPPPSLLPAVSPSVAPPSTASAVPPSQMARPVAAVSTPQVPTEPPWIQPPPENAQVIRDRLAARRMASEGPAAAPEAPQAAPAAVAPVANVAPMKLSQAVTVVKETQKVMGLKLTASEANAVARLVKEGEDPVQVIKMLQRQKAAAALAQRLGTPTDSEVAASKPWRRAGMAQGAGGPE